MTPRFPTLTPRKMVKALKKAGFREHSQKGSHLYLRHSDGRWTTVPMHARDLKRGLMFSILEQADINPDDFLKLL
ncbi:type II toxin-antitoxin system HicA family toxin [bacterium]|nr:type II toxin-antitoxin system HicA family toxin [bacterium]